MLKIIAVGLGGFIGSCCRFLISKQMGGFGSKIPLGTLLSNIAAGLIIGLIIGFERQTSVLPEHVKLFLTVGILGGLSTFSTFSLETVTLIESRSLLLAGANILLNLTLSLVMVAAGLSVMKWLV
jgi:CrcB protein